MIDYLFILITSIFLVVQIMSFVQEHLQKLLIYTTIGQLAYFNIFLYKIISGNSISPESIEIAFFYLSVMSFLTLSFFMCTLSMKRAGNSYQVKSIYDLAQIWQIDKKITLGLLILLLGLASFPLFPGFTCRWFFIEEIYNFNKYLGVFSFFTCAFSCYPYLRIINQMFLNKNLMMNERGPRWYFDKLLTRSKTITLILSVIVFIIITLKPSLLWFLCHQLTLVIINIIN